MFYSIIMQTPISQRGVITLNPRSKMKKNTFKVMWIILFGGLMIVITGTILSIRAATKK